MASKIWIASKSATRELTPDQHVYLVYDPDGDPTSNDELIFRGGPEHNNILNLGNIKIENWAPVDISEDELSGLNPFTDRNYTELNTNGKTPEQVRLELSNWAKAQGEENPNTHVILTDVPYTLPFKITNNNQAEWSPALNSNATVRSALNNAGIDFSSNIPKQGGIGGNLPESAFPGSESYYSASGGTIKIGTNSDSIIYNTGGKNTYEITYNSFGRGAIHIIEDGDAGTIDNILFKNIDPDDIRYERDINGDLKIYFPGDGSGDPSVFIHGQFDAQGNPKIAGVWIEPVGGGDPVYQPLGNPDNIPFFLLPQIPSWVPSVLAPFHDGEAARSPLVIDLDGDGIELSALNGAGSVYFDIDNDGFREASGWVTGGDGLLALDKNGNGAIDNQTELFGNNAGSANGFDALKALDSNGDNKITSADAQYANLRVWVDANQDGVSQAGELYALAAKKITSINLAYSNVDYALAGNAVKQESTVTINGANRKIADVWFAYDNVNTSYAGDYTLDVRTLFLPTLRGYGTLPDLHIAMSKDETLLQMVQAMAAAQQERTSDIIR